MLSTPKPSHLITTLSLPHLLLSACWFPLCCAVWGKEGIFKYKHIPKSALRSPHTHTRAVTLTVVVEAVILVVVLVVVLQGRGAAGTQLGQSAAGGGKLRAEVGHFLTGRLDGPINPVCQVLVVFHHFKDFPLRTKPTQSSMMSSGVKPEPSLLPLFYLLLIIPLCSYSHSLLGTHARLNNNINNKKTRASPSLCVLQWDDTFVSGGRKRKWERQTEEERNEEKMKVCRQRRKWALPPWRMCCEQLLSERTRHTLGWHAAF